MRNPDGMIVTWLAATITFLLGYCIYTLMTGA